MWANGGLSGNWQDHFGKNILEYFEDKGEKSKIKINKAGIAIVYIRIRAFKIKVMTVKEETDLEIRCQLYKRYALTSFTYAGLMLLCLNCDYIPVTFKSTETFLYVSFYPWNVAQCLAPSKYSINICWNNK